VNHKSIIEAQAQKIRLSGVLGRSRSYAKLFEFLVRSSLEGRTPKEIEIATEVFAKDQSFDPSQDSMVRVYAHNLRQKIRQFYQNAGSDEEQQIEIPRGEYRFAVVSRDQVSTEAPLPLTARHGSARLIATGLAMLVAGVLLGLAFSDRDSEFSEVAATPLWSSILDDDIPVLVVVGDYYIFGELDEDGFVTRFVREFDVNSPDDLNELITRRPALRDHYQDLDVTYLASSTAFALRDLLGVLYTSDKRVEVVPMSEFDPADMRSNHVVYVGYFSALDKLFEFVFASSSIAIGATFDELWNLDTDEIYTSTAGMPADTRNYRDYGYFSTFPGPSGNQFAVIAGTRDEGVMQIAELVSNPIYLASVEQAMPENTDEGPDSFEMLYEVTGFDRTNIDAMLVHSGALDYREIWRSDLLQFSRP
jgi:hypothetical protein